MTLLDLMEALDAEGHRALRIQFGADAPLPPTLQLHLSTRADLQTAVAFPLAKALKTSPLQIAELLCTSFAACSEIAEATVAGAGFVNLRIQDTWLAHHGVAPSEMQSVGKGKTVVLDYSSPNVAKPMHIGHLRSTILGESLARVLRAVGYHVVTDNHLGDWGTQFGKLLVAYRRWLDPEHFEQDPVEELLRLYILFTEEDKAWQKAHPTAQEGAEDASPLLREARAELVKLQQGDPDNVALWRLFVASSKKEFDGLYTRLGIHFDVELGESFYNDQLGPTVDLLLQQGIAREDQGASVVFFDQEQKGKALPPMLVRKEDGGFLYSTTDVAAMLYRVERWHPNRILIVTDVRQQLHFQQLFAVGAKLGVASSMEHIGFGLMRLPEGTFSTRDGNVIALDTLLDEAERRATAQARECNPTLPEEEAQEVGRVVGLGAVKYNDLSRDRQTTVTFAWDQALALTGNTAPYLLYAYARIRSLLRKGEAQHLHPGPLPLPLHPLERSLLLKLCVFPKVVEEVAQTAKPHLLCEYLFELASLFSHLYQELPILNATPELCAGRLAWVERTGATLAQGLELLGIEHLERM